MAEYLFIGGPKDGCRMELEDPPRDMVFDEFKDDSTASIRFASPRKITIVTHRYRCHPFACGSKRIGIYFHESIKPDDLLDAMIAGYRHPEKANG